MNHHRVLTLPSMRIQGLALSAKQWLRCRWQTIAAQNSVDAQAAHAMSDWPYSSPGEIGKSRICPRYRKTVFRGLRHNTVKQTSPEMPISLHGNCGARENTVKMIAGQAQYGDHKGWWCFAKSKSLAMPVLSRSCQVYAMQGRKP